MPIYAIGDLQGCYAELQDLLNEINFDAGNDRLWFAGDLINRGPDSLACLQFVFETKHAYSVLGNHELHLLATANQVRPDNKDSFDAITSHARYGDYLSWLRGLPLMMRDQEIQFSMVHAGLLPQWSIEQALELAHEAEAVLQGKTYSAFIKQMYGNYPDSWSDTLEGFDRIRCIINSLTRIRYIDVQGRMDLNEKGPPGTQQNNLLPWYQHPDRISMGQPLLFGHWSTVYRGNEGNFDQYSVYPLDSGCLWGGTLTALRLEDKKWFSVPSRQARKNWT